MSNQGIRKEKEERERGKRKMKEKEERERGKRKRKEKEERERGKRKSEYYPFPPISSQILHFLSSRMPGCNN